MAAVDWDVGAEWRDVQVLAVDEESEGRASSAHRDAVANLKPFEGAERWARRNHFAGGRAVLFSASQVFHHEEIRAGNVPGWLGKLIQPIRNDQSAARLWLKSGQS